MKISDRLDRLEQSSLQRQSTGDNLLDYFNASTDEKLKQCHSWFAWMRRSPDSEPFFAKLDRVMLARGISPTA